MCVGIGAGVLLANYECEVEDKFVVIVHFEEKVRYGRRLRILELRLIRSPLGFRQGNSTAATNLDKLDRAHVAGRAHYTSARSGKGVGGDGGRGALARTCDNEGGYRHWQ